MALKYANQLPDVVDDTVRQKLRLIQEAGPNWTSRRHELYQALHEQLMASSAYHHFTGDCRDYHLQRKGDWCLYDVPESQQGALRRFRGQRVRLICTGGWDPYSGRGYFFGAVQRQPLLRRQTSSTPSP